jgi:hypothetical protein
LNGFPISVPLPPAAPPELAAALLGNAMTLSGFVVIVAADSVILDWEDAINMARLGPAVYTTFENHESGGGPHLAIGLPTSLPEILPPVDVTVTPVNPPIIIPANGGTFQYRAHMQNTTMFAQTFHGWTRWRNPSGMWQNLLGPFTLTLPGNAGVTRRRFQNVAGSNPPGVYTFVGYVGPNTSTIWDSSFFTFTKMADDRGGEWVNNNDNWGEEFTDESDFLLPPSSFILSVSPNPFNPTTALGYQLSSPGYVSLKVYDTAGREVVTLVNGWREAGDHELTFDASGLPSGIYFARLEAGKYVQTQKLVLLK